MSHEYLLWVVVIACSLHVAEEAVLDWVKVTQRVVSRFGMTITWPDFYVVNAVMIVGGVATAMIGWILIEIVSRSLFALDRPWLPVAASMIPVAINVALTLKFQFSRPEFLGLGATCGLLAGFVFLFVVAHLGRRRWMRE